MAKRANKPVITGTCHEAGQQLAPTKPAIDLTSIRASIARGTVIETSSNTTHDSSSTGTMVATALTRGIKAEQTRQLKPFLLTRGAHRLVAFWLRHPTLRIPSADNDNAALLASAKEFMTRYGCNKAGNPLQHVEASYKTGPSFSERKKYEIFEDILLWEDGEEKKLRQTGLKAAYAIAADDDKLWAALNEPMAEYWERMAIEAQKQGVVVEQNTVSLEMEMTEQVLRAMKTLQVKVEVLVRKRLRLVGIYEEPVLETGEVDKKKLHWKKVLDPADPYLRRK